jgi:phenylalanine-4-hydroxylase
MFQEANDLYSPVRTGADGEVVVELSQEHPGFSDPAYRARRNDIAALALDWSPSMPIPRVVYTDEEQDVWRLVSSELARKHRTYACRDYVEASERLRLPTDRVPHLDEVSAALEPLTGFRYHPAAGLVPLREFYEAFCRGVFYSTQYVRHHSVPLYTPEPDAVHEIIGHANQIACPRFAALYRLVGDATRRIETREALEYLSRVFWFSMEFGVVREDGEIRAYGAGILSSYGEIEEFRACEMRPLDVHAMGTQDYDITHYQPVLYLADSIGQLEEVLGGFFATMDDDTPARLAPAAAA